MDKNVPIKDSLRWGWYAFKKYAWFLIGIQLVVFVVGGLVGYFTGSFEESGQGGASAILNIAYLIFSIIVSMGFIRTYSKISDQQDPEFADLFSDYRLFFKFLVTQILCGLAIFLGFILLIIPGIIFALKYQFAPMLVVERGYGPLEAMSKSSEITKGAKGSLFVFSILQAIIAILGVIALVVGILVAIPVTTLAGFYIYRNLLHQTEIGDAAPQIENSPPVQTSTPAV